MRILNSAALTVRLKLRDLVSFDKVRAAAGTAIGLLVLGALTGAADASTDIDLTPSLGPVGDPVEKLIVLGIGAAVAAVGAYLKGENYAYGAGTPPRPPVEGEPAADDKFAG